MVILNTRRHEGIVQDAVKRRDQYKVRIAVEDGGKIYGGNGFEKDALIHTGSTQYWFIF